MKGNVDRGAHVWFVSLHCVIYINHDHDFHFIISIDIVITVVIILQKINYEEYFKLCERMMAKGLVSVIILYCKFMAF